MLASDERSSLLCRNLKDVGGKVLNRRRQGRRQPQPRTRHQGLDRHPGARGNLQEGPMERQGVRHWR
jgi:hypothetical protein